MRDSDHKGTDMTEDKLREYYAAWGTGNPDLVASFFSSQCMFEDLAFEARFDGQEGVREFARLTYSGIPDFRVVPTQIAIHQSHAGVAWEMSGTHSGDLPNLPATGKEFLIRASSMITFEDDLILNMVDYWNPIQFKKMVGLL